MSENQNAVIVQGSVNVMLPQNMEVQIQQAKLARVALTKLFNEVMVQDVDFGRVPGTDKPTLLKSGAELLCQIFKLYPGKPDMLNTYEDFDGGLFSYTVGMPLFHQETMVQVAYGMGAGNSQEVKYKYRKDKTSEDKDAKIINPEPADQQNTLIKMASKRAFVDAVLKATGASRMFTQDVEDMPWLKEEKASSKQLEFLKKLAQNDLNNVSAILGKPLTAWEDISRNQASAAINTLKDAGTAPAGNSKATTTRKTDTKATAAAQGEAYGCHGCGIEITKAEHEFSLKKQGTPLCRSCQKDYKAGTAPAEDLPPPEEDPNLPWNKK
jgi:hypothetical protein